MAKIYCKSSYLLRKDTSENWGNKNPVLRKGEQGLETDTGIIKIGDGVTAFNSLSDDNIYFPESYVNSTFANTLNGSKSGSAILIDDVSPVTHEMGVKVIGKNLIRYPYTNVSQTVKGVTFTVNSDGSITVSGTATENVSWYENVPIPLQRDKQYTFSGYISGNGVALRIIDYSYTDYRDVTNANQSATFTPAKDEYFWLITVAKDTAADATLKPQLELGTTPTPYTPFVSDLTNVLVTRCGKNLIQFPYIPLTTEKTVAGITYTPLSDGGIKLNGTAIALSSVVLYNNASQGAVPIILKANLTYMASTGLSSKIGVYIRPFKPSGNSHVAITDVFTTRTITLTEDTLIDQILVVVASGTTVNNVVIYPQIELGSAATGYELYDGQTYTPTADGTVENVKSIYPTTTLMTDTEGAIIEAEYNKDINKAFAELQQAIISLGGNV